MRPLLIVSLAILSLVPLAGCSQNGLLTRQDYQLSQQDFVRGDAARALRDFPRGREEGTFITTMEKGYLSLLQGKPELTGLQKQAALQEDQVRYHVSREARTFFYVQTPEDYYPSEHEVIWLHFLLGWGYAQQGKYSESCVEARAAADLLALPWSPTGHFDDPTMRLFLAGLWTMCGQWREAQVDFRAAWLMDNGLTWAKALAERDKAPPQLFMVLGGPGPEVVWTPKLGANPMRAGRQVSFRLRGHKSALSITDSRGAVVSTHLSPDAGKWYQRHLARESELHELIQDSAYGGKAVASGTAAGGWIAATTGAGILVGLGGTALGGAIMYYGASADAVKLGLVVAGGSISWGMDIAKQGYEDSTRQLKQELDPSPRYRFVRLLPEYLWIGWSDQDMAFPLDLRAAAADIRIPRPSVMNHTAVTVAWLPDAGDNGTYAAGPDDARASAAHPGALCRYTTKTADGSSTTILTYPNAAGACPAKPDW